MKKNTLIALAGGFIFIIAAFVLMWLDGRKKDEEIEDLLNGKDPEPEEPEEIEPEKIIPDEPGTSNVKTED